MTRNIQHKLFFSHPPEVVWEYLTKSELMEQWLMKNDFLPIVGYDFQFRTNPMCQLDFDGIVYCKVLEVVPHSKLSYSWKAGPGEGKITVDSIVVWKLQPKENGTELSLEHDGFMEHIDMYNAMHAGWLKNMHKIAELINKVINGTTHA